MTEQEQAELFQMIGEREWLNFKLRQAIGHLKARIAELEHQATESNSAIEPLRERLARVEGGARRVDPT